MTTISSKTILRSRHKHAPDRTLSTLLLRYPRWIHAEQRTHRIISLDEGLDFLPATPSLMADPALSRNAASSRAIPVDKMIADVEADPAIPLYWGKNIGGMQAHEELTGEMLQRAKDFWEEALENALALARQMANLGRDSDGKVIGAHKQIVNRLLEPFSHITVLVTATEWDNFLELRDHKDAEPHIELLAREVRKCLKDESTVQTLDTDEWHLPFVSADEWEDLPNDGKFIDPAQITRQLIKLSGARCASTSYKTVDGFDMTLERAEAIFDKLVTSKPLHASPSSMSPRRTNRSLAGATRWAARRRSSGGPTSTSTATSRASVSTATCSRRDAINFTS
jgi:hypothetical protein